MEKSKLALVCSQYILKTEVKSYFLAKAFLSDARQPELTPFPLGCVQTDATTPNIVAPTMLGVVACVLAMVCKRCNNSQQCWDLQCIVGRIQPISLCEPCVKSVRGPNNVGRAQHYCATLRRSRNKRNVRSCWLKSLTGFKLCATTRNNIQQHETGCAKGRNM